MMRQRATYQNDLTTESRVTHKMATSFFENRFAVRILHHDVFCMSQVNTEASKEAKPSQIQRKQMSPNLTNFYANAHLIMINNLNFLQRNSSATGRQRFIA